MNAILHPQGMLLPLAKPPLRAKRRAIFTLLVAMTACLSTAATAASQILPPSSSSTTPQPSTIEAPQLKKAYGQLPLSFEPNQGQSDSQVKFLSRGPGYQLFLTATEAVLALQPSSPEPSSEKAREKAPKAAPTVLRMKLLGANSAPHISGEALLPGKVNYLQGKDPAQWHTQIATYAKVKYQGVYPGIDLRYYGHQRQLEYDFIVAPGAHPSTIRLAFEGAQHLAVDAQGALVLDTPGGPVRFHRPVIYQNIAGTRREVAGGYVLTAPHQVGFQVAAYEATEPPIIDPVLSYSTYLGGNGTDKATAIAVDENGQVYVTGATSSTNFPVTRGALQPVYGGYRDAFVAKLSADGSRLLYFTYLGGSDGEQANAIAVDGEGQVYVAGWTVSDDFPVTAGALQPVFGGGPYGEDAFVAKLSADGSSLVYATYLGGSNDDEANGIAVDGRGRAYVAGRTASDDFPVTAGALQPVYGGGAVGDAFVAKISAKGSHLRYATYLGGSHNGDEATAIAVDGRGRVYVTGWTASDNFPITGGVFQPVGGYTDAFVAKLSANGSRLRYATYLGGGSNTDRAYGIAVDENGQAYVAGWTVSDDFPVTADAFQPVFGGLEDVFVAKLSADASTLVYATYLGGSGNEQANGIAVDGHGQAYLTGTTDSDNFPVTARAFRRMHDSSNDGFVAQLSFPIPRWGEITVIEIETSRGSSQRNPSTGHYLEQVTLTNISTTPIRGPFALVVDNLSANTTVVNFSGKTAWDEPYLELNLKGDNTLKVGESITALLELANPTGQPINYVTRVLSPAPATVPEPGTLLLWLIGLGGWGLVQWIQKGRPRSKTLAR